MNVIRILLADDHTVIRKGLRFLLENQPGFKVVAEASDGRETIAMAQAHQPDVVVLDVAMPTLNGIEAAKQISANIPHTAIVFLSMHSDEGYVLRALKSGAKAYLLKDSAEYDLINAIRAVHEGKAFFSPAISKMLVEEYMRQMQEREVDDSYDLLTTREREVLQLLAEGKTNKEVASILELSPHTIETHRSNIFQKLNLHNSAELILYAVRKGVIAWHQRAKNRGDRVQAAVLTEKVIWQLLQPYAEIAGLTGIAPHDLKRSCAKMCRAAGGELEQIQLLLGHASVQTTERYLGTKQNLV